MSAIAPMVWRLLRPLHLLPLSLVLAACSTSRPDISAGRPGATPPPHMAGQAPRSDETLAQPAWTHRLAGDSIVLLGEVHDNPEGHRLRLDVLRRAVADGWRPAIVMEQFDIERQADIERARRERPRDAQHVVDAAGGGPRSTWHWPFYLPIIELALEHDLPLVAGNLSRADAGRVVREGYAQALGASRVAALGLDGPLAAGLQAAQEREVDVGHCGALPPSMLLPMARAQFARDAVMADALRSNAAGGTVLIAGNGHARRDLGVPRWLGPALQHRELAVGFLEGEAPSPDAYDVVVEVPALPRTDPCLGLQGSVPPAGDGTGATGGQSGR